MVDFSYRSHGCTLQCPMQLYFANMSAKDIASPTYMILRLARNILKSIVHADSNQSGKTVHFCLGSTTQAAIVPVGTANLTPAKGDRISRRFRSRNISNNVSNVHYKPLKNRENQMDNHSHWCELHNTENTSHCEIPIQDKCIAYQAKRLFKPS